MAALLVNIDVDDLDRAVDFYTRALELRVGRRFGAGGIELLGSSAPIYLLVKPRGSTPFAGAGAGRDYGRHWTPVHLDFVVDDLDTAVHRAEAAGATVEDGISTHAWGRMAVFRDPFGHGFCLLAFTGRGYDEIATP
jgi:catechol 2,3-dioxygenase-like lactoylglutathione lyase family enzyme